jgi:hypothetical protein
MEVPAQPALDPCPLTDEVVAVVDEEASLHRGRTVDPGQERPR